MKSQLAVAIAQGIPVARWATENQVAQRTAYRWAAHPKVRAAVDRHRRHALGRAPGRVPDRARWAARQIAKLAKRAASESMKLSELKVIWAGILAFAQLADIELAMIEFEIKLYERVGK